MARYRSDDSDEDSRRRAKKKSKKRRARSRSRSVSEEKYVSNSKKKSKKKRDRSYSRSPSRNSRRSSRDRHYGGSSRRSRSASPRKDRRSISRSRSPSPRKSRRSVSRSRSPSPRRGRRSISRTRSRRSRSRSASVSKDSRRSRSPDRNRSEDRVSGPSSTLTSAQQAAERMKLALKAAAAADQKLRGEPEADGLSLEQSGSSRPQFSSEEESQRFARSVEAIDSGNFKQAAFKTAHGNKNQGLTPHPSGPSHDDAIFGSLAVKGFTVKPDMDTKPLQMDPETIIHPRLFCDPEEQMERWIDRLTQLRKRKLEGEAL